MLLISQSWSSELDCSIISLSCCYLLAMCFVHSPEGASVAQGARQGETSRSRVLLFLSNLVTSAMGCDEAFLWWGWGHSYCDDWHSHQPDCGCWSCSWTRWGATQLLIHITFCYLDCGMVAKYCNENVCVCVSVCLSVCIFVCPRAYLLNHVRNLYQIFVHVAYGLGSVLLQHGDEISKGRGNFGGFLPPLTMHCTA